MVLKVSPEELLNVSNTMISDSDKTKAEIEKMEKSLEKLRTIWEGQDAKAFCDNLEMFLKKLKGIPTTLDTISKICNETNNGYKSRDEEFAKVLETEAIENE